MTPEEWYDAAMKELKRIYGACEPERRRVCVNSIRAAVEEERRECAKLALAAKAPEVANAISLRGAPTIN